ncbi:MAG: putative sulfate exporter family transporter, partial [Epsilonproteobacteria bacterium]|nr:putative sulfate exporter family transporter [Campylobacterota bacterium]
MTFTKRYDLICGVGLSVFLAFIAFVLDKYIPIGSAVIAIILGVIVSNSIHLPTQYNKGIGFSEKTLLAVAIATMGITLDFSVLIDLGAETLLLILSGIVVTIFAALFIAKFFNIDKNLALLLGIGNGICGASAIGASKDIIKAKDSDVGIAVAVVNLLGTVGIFLVPFIAISIGFDDKSSGILVGNTLQAVGQAVAGGFAISDVAGQNATIVKMGRVLSLTLVLIVLLFIFLEKDNNQSNSKISVFKNIPLFILFFLFFSFMATVDVLPLMVVDIVKEISHFTLIVAMAAIGLKISFSSIKENGKNALIVGSLVFVVQI